MVKASKKPALVYQLKITLVGARLPIWRRFQVLSDTPLVKLDLIIQTVMGWENSHLHHFKFGELFYGPTDPEWDSHLIEEKPFSLDHFVKEEKSRFSYQYDFGDCWDHELLVEKIFKLEPGKQYPVCLEGQRACPPEDSGGVPGYYDKLEIVANPAHPEHDHIAGWMPRNFNPEKFDLAKVNQKLKKL